MRKHRNKIEKILRVWIAAISVFAAASEVQASSSFVDSLPELDRRTLLRGIRKPKSPGKLPSKYVANSERVENQELVQHEFNYADDAVDLTWDDSADSMFYGQDDATVSEEKQDALVLKALSYYPEQQGDTHHLSEMIAAIA